MVQYFLAVVFALSTVSSLNATTDDKEVFVFEKRTPTGRLEERFSYYLKGDVKVEHGKYELFYNDGQLMTVVMYQHGKKSGPTTTFYKWINKRSSETEYSADCQHGRERHWSPEGELIYESTWENGVAIAGRVFESGISSGLDYEHRTVVYEKGIRKAGSEKSIRTSYERPKESNQLPDFNQFLRWSYPTYDYGSTYRFQYQLPSHDQIPEVLAIRKAGGTKGERVIDSQLETLTRFEPKYGSSKEEKQLAWENWWANVGSQYAETTKVRVAKDPEAWRIACKGRALPVPESPVVLPMKYSLTFTFQSGDYMGVCKEKMALQRTETTATLRRTYSTSTYGDETTEHWQGMSIEQADTITRAVGYVIDHPWLQNDEVEINRRYWKEKTAAKRPDIFSVKRDKLRGRESFGWYQASSDFEFNDGDGNIWWNADPTLWYGPNEDRYNWSSPRSPGGIYSFFVEQFPESQKSDGQTPGWTSDYSHNL